MGVKQALPRWKHQQMATKFDQAIKKKESIIKRRELAWANVKNHLRFKDITEKILLKANELYLIGIWGEENYLKWSCSVQRTVEYN